MEHIYNLFEAFISLVKTFKLKDALDIIIVSIITYALIKLVRETRAWQLVKGILILIFAYILSTELNLKMLETILNNFLQFGVLAVLIVFQPELRRAIEYVGRSNIYGLSYKGSIMNSPETCIDEIVNACITFKNTKTGALIVFERTTKLGEIVNTGTIMEAKPSDRLISNIFFNKSPLHDGAMIIRNGLVYAAGCILPLTKKVIDADLGTRHRAAYGISEVSDAFVIVVSEETGNISLIINGTIKRDYNRSTLTKALYSLLSPEEPNEKFFKHFSFPKSIKKKGDYHDKI